MSFWDGTRWVEEQAAPAPTRSRRANWAATAVMVAGLVAMVVPFASTSATTRSYAPTLGVTFASAATTVSSASTPYVVAGCGYNSAYGGVTVVVTSPAAVSFAGQLPDANGCISVTNFSTLGSGHYKIDAWQHVRNKGVVVAVTSFDW